MRDAMKEVPPAVPKIQFSCLVVVLAAALLPAAQTARAQSLSPLFTDQDVVFEPSLLGDWGEFTLQQGPDNSYDVVVRDTNTIKLRAYLVRLGRYYFFDVTPDNLPRTCTADFPNLRSSPGGSDDSYLAVCNDSGLSSLLVEARPGKSGDSYQVKVIKAHLIFRAWLDGPDNFRVGLASEDWLKRCAADGSLALPYRMAGDDVFLTASTEELQRFFYANAENPENFDTDMLEFHRK
jgi:hypothetical protein